MARMSPADMRWTTIQRNIDCHDKSMRKAIKQGDVMTARIHQKLLEYWEQALLDSFTHVLNCS